MSALRSPGHARRWAPAVLAALAALAFAADAHADDLLLPVPTDPMAVEAVVTEIQVTVETTVETAGADVAVPAVSDLAGPAEPAPVEAPETALESEAQPTADPQPAAGEAPAPAVSADPEPAVAPEEADAGDTDQYQPEAEPSSPAPAPATSDDIDQAPDEWTWIWNWNCADPVEIPRPSGNSWTWIWNWNCGTQSPTADAISHPQAEQYQPSSDRYHGENTSTLSPTNSNISIRIFSPGDDGAITQLNSTVSTVTNLTTTLTQTIYQTVHQTTPALPIARDGPLPVLQPPVATAPLVASFESIGAELASLLEAGFGGTLGDAEAAVPSRAAGTSDAPSGRAWTGGLGDRESRWASSTIPQRAAPSLDAAPATARSSPEQRAASRKRHSTPSHILFPSPVAPAGGAAGGGTGSAFAGFLLALTIAHLVVPPGIRRRVRFAEGRPPRGVDLGGDGRPG